MICGRTECVSSAIISIKGMKDEKNRNVFTEDQKPLYGILQWKKLAGNDDAFNLVSAWFLLGL